FWFESSQSSSPSIAPLPQTPQSGPVHAGAGVPPVPPPITDPPLPSTSPPTPTAPPALVEPPVPPGPSPPPGRPPALGLHETTQGSSKHALRSARNEDMDRSKLARRGVDAATLTHSKRGNHTRQGCTNLGRKVCKKRSSRTRAFFV